MWPELVLFRICKSSDFSAEFQQSASGSSGFFLKKKQLKRLPWWYWCYVVAICVSLCFVVISIGHKWKLSVSPPLSLHRCRPPPPLPLLHSAEQHQRRQPRFVATAVRIGRVSASAGVDLWVTVGCGRCESWRERRGRVSGFVLQHPLTSSWISGVRSHESSCYFSAHSGWHTEVSNTWFLIIGEVRNNYVINWWRNLVVSPLSKPTRHNCKR